jgi:hypothetical protein
VGQIDDAGLAADVVRPAGVALGCVGDDGDAVADRELRRFPGVAPGRCTDRDDAFDERDQLALGVLALGQRRVGVLEVVR